MNNKRRRPKGRGNGYNWDEGKSNNALSAEQKGLLLAGVVAKKMDCTTDFIQYNAPYEEWHHVSGWFNKKRYFDLDKVKQWWDVKGKELWAIEKMHIDEDLSKTGTVCTIRFSEWINRKTVEEFECEALILKQGKKLCSFEIRSDVWLIQYWKADKKYHRVEVQERFKLSDKMNKKIEFVKDLNISRMPH